MNRGHNGWCSCCGLGDRRDEFSGLICSSKTVSVVLRYICYLSSFLRQVCQKLENQKCVRNTSDKIKYGLCERARGCPVPGGHRFPFMLF